MDDQAPAYSAPESPVPPRLPPRPSSHRVANAESVKPPPLPPRSSAATSPAVRASLDASPTIAPAYTSSPAPTLAPAPVYDESPAMESAGTPPAVSMTLPSEAPPEVLDHSENKLDLPLQDVREPTEAELREEYDNQEIEKYLTLFSAVSISMRTYSVSLDADRDRPFRSQRLGYLVRRDCPQFPRRRTYLWQALATMTWPTTPPKQKHLPPVCLHPASPSVLRGCVSLATSKDSPADIDFRTSSCPFCLQPLARLRLSV